EEHCIVRFGNFGVVPLITRRSQQVVRVLVHMYRREAPGSILVTGGDIDNRLKILFDALRMPHSLDEIPDDAAERTRLYGLLEDDAVIWEVRVETHRLFTPVGSELETDVRLAVHVEITPEGW